MKRCARCRQEKNDTHFHKNSKHKDGLQVYCKECMCFINRTRYKKKRFPRGETGGKQCIGCNRWLPIENFIKKNESNLYQSRCRECSCEYFRVKYAENKQYYIDKRSEWISQPENKAKVDSISRKWIKKHYHENENYRLAHLIRTKLSNAYKTYIRTGRIPVARHPAINYEEIFNSLGPCPGEYGIGKYTVHHICSLRLFDLTDPNEYAIAVHPKNVRWELSKTNYDLGQSWDEDLYNEIKRELNENTNTRNKKIDEEV